MREFHLSFMRKNYRKEEDAIRAYERTIEKPDNNLATVLHYLDENFDLGMLYYPGSGFHIKPRDTLGENRVTHLSLQPEHYFKHLGEGIKVVGDYRNTSFPDNSFDSSLVWGATHPTIKDAVEDILRVTKVDGLFVVGYNESFSQLLDDKLVKVNLPEELDQKIQTYRNVLKTV